VPAARTTALKRAEILKKRRNIKIKKKLLKELLNKQARYEQILHVVLV